MSQEVQAIVVVDPEVENSFNGWKDQILLALKANPNHFIVRLEMTQLTFEKFYLSHGARDYIDRNTYLEGHSHKLGYFLSAMIVRTDFDSSPFNMINVITKEGELYSFTTS